MTRSVKAVLHYAFENLKLNKIEIGAVLEMRRAAQFQNV